MNILWIILLSVLPGTINSNDLATAVALEKALENPPITPTNSNSDDIDGALLEKKRELKQRFGQELVAALSSEKGQLKSFEMTSDDHIEKRAINRDQINYLIDILSNEKKNAKNYYNYRKHFCVKTINDEKYLYSVQTEKQKQNYPNGGRIAALEDIFDICWTIHQSVGHQGRDTMLNEAKKFYDNITRPIVELFLKYSEEYQLKRKKIKNHGFVVKPIRSSDFNSRWQIDLIDFRTLPDGEFNWILTVQDHCTKFVWLVPLKQKSGQVVAKALFDLFGVFGAPCILQSDNGKELILIT